MKQETGPARLALRTVIIAGGVGSSILFVFVGVVFQLQLFGDTSFFSYAVAAQSAWSFHWHNISGRLLTYLFAYPLAEAVVAISRNAQAGITVFGFLFFAAPLLGLALTFAFDRTPNRTIFVYACLSTVCLCPLIYGAPTEMWTAHAMFWPALALCLSAPTNGRWTAAIFAALLALVFTHEGAIVLSLGVLLALLLRGWRDPKFVRAFWTFCATLLIWATVKALIRPDSYIAPVLAAAAFKFIDIRDLIHPVFLLLLAALAIYASLLVLLRWMNLHKAHLYASGVCAAALAIYWTWFDESLLTEARYNLRTVLLIMIPILGCVASVSAMDTAERHGSWFPFLPRWVTHIGIAIDPQTVTGALLLIMLVHAVETSKFVLAWLDYKSAVRAVATGAASDPGLGSPLFVSSRRIDTKLNRLAWNSTIPYLSVLVAPGLAPTRLVVDPDAGYFWLSCQTARQSEATSGALPESTRRLVRIHACLHRP